MESHRHPDSHLWAAAFGLSVVASLCLFALLGLLFQKYQWRIELQARPKSEEASVPTLYLETVRERPADASPAKPEEKPFARTSPDQPESTEMTKERIGERSTQASSERVADPNAEALPSQNGIKARDGEIETTESQYQDGELIPSVPTAPSDPGNPSAPSAAASNPQAMAQNASQTDALERRNPVDTPAVENPEEPTLSEERSLPPPREALLEGPESVEVNVPREEGESKRPRETPQRQVEQPASDAQPPSQEIAANPSTQPKTKNFQGYQRKTAMVGSISRTGRSALNVDDTELGRYQAAISKAVELEWQRNCVRHRDFITPGFLTVRFYVEPSGRVRSVNFLGEMETGEVQKGFTLSSIREADLPKMPKELAEAYDGDTLELVFRFYF